MSRKCESHTRFVADRVVDICYSLCSSERIFHMSGVESFARELVPSGRYSFETIRLLAWGHDMFRDLPGNRLLRLARYYGVVSQREEELHPVSLHGKVAAAYLSDRFGVDDAITKAIHWHVTGSAEMGELGEILMIADMGEEGREFAAASEIRLSAFVDRKKTALDVIRFKMLWALEERRPILDEIVSCWNHYLRRYQSDTD